MSLEALPADAPAWAQVLFAKVDQVAQALRANRTASDPMITANECDHFFRLARGTARKEWEQGRVIGQLRKGRSPTGQVLYLDRADCARRWVH